MEDFTDGGCDGDAEGAIEFSVDEASAPSNFPDVTVTFSRVDSGVPAQSEEGRSTADSDSLILILESMMARLKDVRGVGV